MSHPSAVLAIESAGVRLTGRTVRPTSPPRGTIVAIHGGTYDSEYYDANDDSLLTTAPRRGYTVVALDRPGYGSSRAPADSLSFSAQAQVLGGPPWIRSRRTIPGRSSSSDTPSAGCCPS
ncbi:alpha/beta fold hydrolase [Gordonia phthalatica]|uniref:alpha/beta hydrolase n=1 Tax=Gordonia phthalatica TaxID=1136941 RepID=UPI0012FF29A8